MAVRELPEYKSNKDNYIYTTDTQGVVDKILSDNPPILAIDTETHYEEGHPERVIRFIKGSPNNTPFGASLFYGDIGYWLTKDLHLLEPLYNRKGVILVGHNIKFDMHMSMNMGINVFGFLGKGQPHEFYADTMTMIHLINERHKCKTPNDTMVYSKRLKDLGYHYLDEDSHELEDLVDEYRRIIAVNTGRSKKEVSYKEVSDANPELMKDYAVLDVEITYKLYFIFLEKLKRQELLQPFRIDMNATLAVLDIERRGIRVDVDKMQSDEALLTDMIHEVKHEIFNIVPPDININSGGHLVRAIQNLYNIKWEYYTPKNEYNTSKEVLQEVAINYPETAVLMGLLIEYRKAIKILDTYITGIYPLIQQGRVHCDYWINPNDFGKGGTVTGRLSSSNPNLQNVTKKPVTVRGVTYRPRSYYIADENQVLAFMDYDAQEYSVLGHYGQDKRYMKLLNDGLDVHKGTYATLYNVPYDEVTKEQRSLGKTYGFGLVYGLGNASFAKALGYDLNEDLYNTATRQFLYKQYKAYELPPYGNIPLEDVLKKLDTTEIEGKEEVAYAIRYFYSDATQEAIVSAKDTKVKYFNNFPGIKTFLKSAQYKAEQRGWVKTYWGRERHFENKKRDGYKAPNAIIQGTCSDIMKIKLYELLEFNASRKSGTQLSVHDEVGMGIDLSEIGLIKDYKKILETLPFRVTITTGLELAKNWGEKVEVDDMAKVPEVLETL